MSGCLEVLKYHTWKEILSLNFIGLQIIKLPANFLQVMYVEIGSLFFFECS